MSLPRSIMISFAIALAAWTSVSAQTDAFRTRPITLIVPFPAGGPSDALARAIAQGMAAHLKQSIVVENISGASGTVGLAKVVQASPDGSTLGFGTVGTHVANAALYKKLPYDPLSDFEPIGLAGTAPTMLVARPTLPVTDLKDFVAYAEAHRARMTYGSAGLGSISHVTCVILLSALKQNITHVPYRGVAPAMNDLMGGHIDFMCDQSTTALPQVSGGKIKAVAVLSDQRLPQLPDVATAASAGYDVNIRSWNAIFAPARTPAHIVGQLNEALRAAVTDAALVRQMKAVGVDLPAASNWRPLRVRTDREGTEAGRAGAQGARRISRLMAATLTLMDIATPAALLDEARMMRNIARMQSRMAMHGVRLRPHVKTPKCIEVARRQRAAGASGITVSTLKEAEEFFAAGFTDVLYAVCISPAQFARVLALPRSGARSPYWSIRLPPPRPWWRRGGQSATPSTS